MVVVRRGDYGHFAVGYVRAVGVILHSASRGCDFVGHGLRM